MDNSNFQLFEMNRRQYVRRRKREALMEPCLTSTETNGEKYGEKYKNILQNYAVPSGQQSGIILS